MHYNIPFKKAGNFSLPILGLGTYNMGGRLERDPGNDDSKDIVAIKTAIRLGITHIDTAEIYAEGHAERLIAKAIKELDRNKLFIVTKVYPNHLRYDDIIASAKASLERMDIQHIDLYLIHAHNQNISLEESMKAMDFLIENDIVKSIGVSNFDIPLIQEAQSYTKYKIVNNQIHYSLYARAYNENGVLDFCQKNNILITAYRPLGKYGDITKTQNEMLEKIEKKYNKTKAQIAIHWVIQKPNIVALVKTSDPNHLRENLGALDWKLDSEDEKNLSENFPRGETINVP